MSGRGAWVSFSGRQALGMSYRAVWGKIRAAEDRLGQQLLLKQSGGISGGGSELTPFARNLLKRYDKLQSMTRAKAEFNRALCESGRLVVTDVYTRDTGAISSINDLELPFCISGIMTKESLSNSLSQNGFVVELWEDHSYVLKEFIIQLIMEHGSTQAFCGRHNTNTADPPLNMAALKKEYSAMYGGINCSDILRDDPGTGCRAVLKWLSQRSGR